MLLVYIGNIIRERRKELEITQTVLAELAGVSKNTLYKLERGTSNPSIKVIEELLIVLGMELKIEVKK
ncbi:MAG: helix-turn-helix transcriptional regulator [Bacteroidota bacterium]